MKRIIIISAVICFALFAKTEITRGLDIIKDGKPVATIVTPDNADSFTKDAAGWIQQYVKMSTDAELPILSESKAQESGPRICVGATKAAKAAGINCDA
jgi:hypothetical protein